MRLVGVCLRSSIGQSSGLLSQRLRVRVTPEVPSARGRLARAGGGIGRRHGLKIRCSLKERESSNLSPPTIFRGLAQLVSAPRLGRGGSRFESGVPDHLSLSSVCGLARRSFSVGGCSSMVELLLSKQKTAVRSRSPAPPYKRILHFELSSWWV